MTCGQPPIRTAEQFIVPRCFTNKQQDPAKNYMKKINYPRLHTPQPFREFAANLRSQAELDQASLQCDLAKDFCVGRHTIPAIENIDL